MKSYLNLNCTFNEVVIYIAMKSTLCIFVIIWSVKCDIESNDGRIRTNSYKWQTEANEYSYVNEIRLKWLGKSKLCNSKILVL